MVDYDCVACFVAAEIADPGDEQGAARVGIS